MLLPYWCIAPLGNTMQPSEASRKKQQLPSFTLQKPPSTSSIRQCKSLADWAWFEERQWSVFFGIPERFGFSMEPVKFSSSSSPEMCSRTDNRERLLVCRFSDAGNDDLTPPSGGRRPKSAADEPHLALLGCKHLRGYVRSWWKLA